MDGSNHFNGAIFLSWLWETIKILIPVAIGYLAALSTIRHQIRRQNDSNIIGFLNVTMTEVFNSYVCANELLLSSFVNNKIGTRFVSAAPLDSNILSSIIPAYAECLNKELSNSFVRVRDIRNLQNTLVEKKSSCLDDYRKSNLSDEQWIKHVDLFLTISCNLTYFALQLIKETPKRFAGKFPDDKELMGELSNLLLYSIKEIKAMVLEIRTDISKDKIDSVLQDAYVMIKAREEKEKVKHYHIENAKL